MAEKDVSILDKLGVNIGYKTTHMKTITENDIKLFAEVSGDFNPVHVSEEYAKKTFFGGRIAHGALAQALLSAAMAKLPGLVIFLSQ
ncbi:(R)-specific enoyl-CoA hydratase [subsurface metagenome]